MAEITQELQTIATDVYGRNVKRAIHDALDKINQDLESIEPGGDASVYAGIAVDVMHCTDWFAAGCAYGEITVVQETVDTDRTSVTLSIDIPHRGIFLVCAAHQGNVTATSGEEKIIESKAAVYQNIEQKITVWYDTAVPGSRTVTITQDVSAPISVKLIVLHNTLASGDVVVDQAQDDLISAVPFTPTAKTEVLGHKCKRLYLVSSIGVSDYLTTMSVVVDNNGTSLQKFEERRFSMFYDGDENGENVPIFSYFRPNSYIPETMNILTLNIMEV
jgi:hypothetical protein